MKHRIGLATPNNVTTIRSPMGPAYPGTKGSVATTIGVPTTSTMAISAVSLRARRGSWP